MKVAQYQKNTFPCGKLRGKKNQKRSASTLGGGQGLTLGNRERAVKRKEKNIGRGKKKGGIVSYRLACVIQRGGGTGGGTTTKMALRV